MKIFLLLFFLSLNFKLFAQDSCLRVGTTGDYPPFSHLQNKKYIGFDIELAKRFAQSLSQKPCFIQTSWPTLIKDMKGKKFDLALSGITITDLRKKFGYFSHGHIKTGKVIVYRCKNNLVKNASSLDNKKFTAIVNPGGTNQKYLQEHFSKVRQVIHEDNRSIFQQIIYKKADFMITDSVEAHFQSLKQPELCVKKPLLKGSIGHLAAYCSTTQLAQQFNDFLDTFKASGEFKQLKKRFNIQ